MGVLFSKEPQHQQEAKAPHRVLMPRPQRSHDLKRSREDELTATQQKDAKVVQQILIGGAAVQLLWHFVMGPWWDKRRRRRGSQDA